MNRAHIFGFFTLGVPPERYQLPHPLLGLPVILLIHRILLRAFELLRVQGFNLAEAHEDEITAALRSIIQNRLREDGSVAGFSKRTYESVVRQGQWANYDGTILTKTPDLCFRLRDDENPPRPVLPEFNGLFVECKPVDAKHPVSSRYCEDGLIRFVRGDYAWAMQEGMMLGYARDGRTVAKDLIPVMSKPRYLENLKTVSPPVASRASSVRLCPSAEAIHVSQHRRGFPWPHHKGAATDITVYHLWHDCG